MNLRIRTGRFGRVRFSAVSTLISVIILTSFHHRSFAKSLRCAGEFSISADTAAPALDPYAGQFLHSLTRHHTVRVRLTVDSQFSGEKLSSFEIKKISSSANSVFLECDIATVKLLCKLPGVRYCSISQPVTPFLDSARHQSGVDAVHGTAPTPFSSPYTGKGVLTGILDTEFDTRHPAFLDSLGKTRFIALWDQHDSTGALKNRFKYGTIKNSAELLTDSAFGRVAGNHGTHTTSIMAGSFSKTGYTGAAPEAMIAAVRYSGSEEIIDGISWIFSLADSMKVPCVINLSLGVASGPHDGTSSIDQAIDSLSGAGRIVVGAVGNDGAVSSHIKFTLDTKDTGRTWILPSIDTLSEDSVSVFSGMDIWGEQSKYFSVTLLVLDRPTGRYLKSSTSISTSRTMTTDVDSIVWTDPLFGTSKFYFIVSVERSSRFNKKTHCTIYTRTMQPRFVSGIAIANSSTSQTTIHGWNITRNAVNNLGIEGFISGDTLYSVNEIGGTARRNITVGGYIGRVELPLWNGEEYLHTWLTCGDAFYSSGFGPTVDGRTKPDISAPAWSVVAAISSEVPRDYHDVVVWPDTSTTYGRYGGNTGTSMASPFVAGIVALMLQVKPDLTPEMIRTVLQKTALHDSFTGTLDNPDNRWGAGKINALGAMLDLLDMTVSVPASGASPASHSIRLWGNQLRFSGFSEKCNYSLFTIGGRCVISEQEITGSSAVLPSGIPAGFYIVKLHPAAGGRKYQPVNIVIVR